MTPTAEPEFLSLPPADPESQEQDPEALGPNNENLPLEIVDALKKIVIEVQDEQGYGKYLRRIEVMREWRNDLYEQGTQHIYWQGGPDGGGFALVSPGGLVQSPSGQKVQAPRFVDDYDIVGPYANILTAVQTQDPPDISFRPKNAKRPEDVAAASEAECYHDIYNEQNDTSAIDVQIYRKLMLSGRVVVWNRTVDETQELGYDDGDPDKPAPFERSKVYGTIDSRVPILSKDQKACFYCGVVEDFDVNVLKGRWKNSPNVSKITAGEDGIGESKYERMARLGVLQNAGRLRGNAFPNLTAESYFWLRPSNWERECVENEKDQLQQMFPQGCRVCFVGEQYVGSWAESMDECLVIIGGIRPNSGMFQRALIDPIITIQDSLNDAENTSRLIWEVGWGSTWWAAEETEYDAVTSQVADPGSIRWIKDLPAGATASDRFYREEDASEPETFVQHKETLRSTWPQLQLAAQPALFGGAEAQDAGKTASGYAQANKNALGTQGLAFRVKEGIWAQIYYQCALAASKREEDQPMVSSDGRVLNKEKLTAGKFGAYPDRDSSFPESTPAKRQVWQNTITMAGTSPKMMEMLDNPQNIEEYVEVMGLDLTVPEAEAGRKQQAEIAELLQNVPTPPDPQMTQEAQVAHAAASVQGVEMGQPPTPFVPPPPMSTIQPQPLDYHFWEFVYCQAWLSSPECARELKNGNDGGVENVRLHAMEHWQMKGQVQWPTGAPAPVLPPGMPPPGLNAQPGVGTPTAPAAAPAPIA